MKLFNNRTNRNFDLYSSEAKKNGVYVYRGRSTTINVGDVIEYTGHDSGFQVKKIEKRDHRGVFKDPKNKKNSFFTATCERVKMSDIYEQLNKEKENAETVKD